MTAPSIIESIRQLTDVAEHRTGLGDVQAACLRIIDAVRLIAAAVDAMRAEQGTSEATTTAKRLARVVDMIIEDPALADLIDRTLQTRRQLKMGELPHIVGGEFQSDKYPACPRGKVPLSTKDKTAQDLCGPTRSVGARSMRNSLRTWSIACASTVTRPRLPSCGTRRGGLKRQNRSLTTSLRMTIQVSPNSVRS
jgi:hypothetical protein